MCVCVCVLLIFAGENAEVRNITPEIKYDYYNIMLSTISYFLIVYYTQ